MFTGGGGEGVVYVDALALLMRKSYSYRPNMSNFVFFLYLDEVHTHLCSAAMARSRPSNTLGLDITSHRSRTRCAHP